MAGTALVTGATAGIGRAFAEQLAALGHPLLLVARDGARLEALAADLATRHGHGAEGMVADLSTDAGIDAVAARIAATPDLAVLVNNAGFGTTGSLAVTAPGPQAQMLHLHTLAPMRLTQAALPGMLARRAGWIINVSSVASFVASPGNVNYCATKSYLTVFSEGLAGELRGTGVTVQALCPGFTRTEFHDRMQRSRDSHAPAWMWMSADAVVADSIAAARAGGPVVVVPGLVYKFIVLLTRLLPRRAVLALAARRYNRLQH